MPSTNYAPLIAIWPTLSPGTTAAKLAQLNAMTVSGSVPTLINTGPDAIFNCLVFSEVNALTATEEARLWNMLHIPGSLQGGSASKFIAPFFGSLAAKMPQTITALVALSQAIVQPWWKANGFTSPTNTDDLIAAGNLT